LAIAVAGVYGYARATVYELIDGDMKIRLFREHDFREPTRGWRRSTLMVVAATLFTASVEATAAVNVNVTQVGFPVVGRASSFGNANVVRRTTWTPIIVDLDLIDQTAFDGTLHVAQFDTDGDQHFDNVEIHLRADTGGNQRVWLYTMVNPHRDSGRVYVELLDQQGEVQQIITAGEQAFRAGPVDDKQAIQIDDDALLILSVGSATMGHVKDIVESEDAHLYYREVFVGHIAPSDLPELWIGLESIDIIVWDSAKPEELTARQLEALIHWVRQGGTLLLSASQSAGSIKLAEQLYALLPVELGDVTPVDNLRDVRKELLAPPLLDDTKSERVAGKRAVDENWFKTPFPVPIPVVRCTLRPDARRVAPSDEDQPLVVARRTEGRGIIIFSGVTIRDLLTGDGGATDLFNKLLWLNQRYEAPDTSADAVSLFSEVVRGVAFTTSSSIYLLAASIFSIAYVMAATGGVWWFLGKRGWRRHSWSIFGVVAIGAGFLSVTGVRAFQGFGERVHQISVVDLAAGDTLAHAAIFFGLKTATDARLDVWLPQDPRRDEEPAQTTAFLRPLPPGRGLFDESTSFTDPVPYRIVPSSAVVGDARFRATLKRFEGRWDGMIDGTVTGELTVKGRVFTEESYLVNELGVDLTNCWLIHTIKDVLDDINNVPKGFRSDGWIFALPMGDMNADGRKVPVAERCYKPDADESMNEFLNRARLSTTQASWSRAFRSVLSNIGLGESVQASATLADAQKAMLLASTIGELDPETLKSLSDQMMGMTQTWSRDRLRWLDLRNQMTPDTALLIGFARNPGPTRLFRRSGDRRYRMIEPEKEYSWTMYRIRIPVTVKKSESDKHT